MKTVLDIGSFENNSKAENTLLVEIGETYCQVSSLSNETKSVSALRIFTFDFIALEESVRQIFNDLHSIASQFSKVVVSPAFPQALLVPRKLYNMETAMVASVYDEKNTRQFDDFIGEWQVTNSYTMPENIHQLVLAQFPSAVFLHAYTPLVKVHNGFAAEHQIVVHFVHNIFRVVVKKQGQLQLVQTYSYTAPMDVVYYLLKICTDFQLPPQETLIVLSGLIDENSALYKELYSYFLHLHFAKTEVVSLPENNFPQHFFASLYNLIACVS